ncbi:MAG: hypothetical protein Q4A60_01335 [Pasteurellaceae bacterium]|nr:hypothetical protein [Pasteurellaceae bacterium]
MKSIRYLIFPLGVAILSACDNGEDKVFLKDAPASLRTSFSESFKASCIENEMMQKGVTEDMRPKLIEVCECGLKKAENIVTVEHIEKMQKGDQKVVEEVISHVKTASLSCL